MNKAVAEFLEKGYTPSPKRLKYVKDDGTVDFINPLPDVYTDEEVEFGEAFCRYFYDYCGGDVEKAAAFVACIPEDKTLRDVAILLYCMMEAEDKIRKISQK